MSEKITIEVQVKAPIDKAWKYFNDPEKIVIWNNASDDWGTTKAENELRTGGAFNYRMESKDGTKGFDFGGIYDEVETNKLIRYTIGDGRKVEVHFKDGGDYTNIVETFEAESENTIEKQREGWQAILNNYKKYTEEN